MEKRRKKFRIKAIFKYIGLTLASFITLIVVALFVLLYGPFHQLRDLYVITMLETSAAKFMATWFLSDAKIAEILEKNRQTRRTACRNHTAGTGGIDGNRFAVGIV